jgi:hypothetical protein
MASKKKHGRAELEAEPAELEGEPAELEAEPAAVGQAFVETVVDGCAVRVMHGAGTTWRSLG